MIRLGNIEYSNCFPVHARLVECGAPGLTLVNGVPSRLNALLESGEIDVAPCSSIEYARHADRYRILPDFVIGSHGPIGSIRFETRYAPSELDGRIVAVPTASATSVVLLRILLEQRYGVTPEYRWFDQAAADPLQDGCDAALWIGDVALRRNPDAIDLGAEWTEWTSLPFAFAVWQVSAGPDKDDELRALQERLRESYEYFLENAETLAERNSVTFGLTAPKLLAYWRSLQYRLDDSMERALNEFFRRAHALGESAAPPLRWLSG